MTGLLELAVVLLPVVAVLGLGYGLRCAGVLDDTARQAAGRLVFWVCLPALLIAKLADHPLAAVFDPLAVGIGWGVFLLGFVACLLVTRRAPPRERGALISGLGRFNGAFVGLPVVVMWSAALAPERAGVLTAAYLVLLACMAPLTQLLGILGILMPLHGTGRAGWRRIGRGLAGNPLIWSCAIGIGLALLLPGRLASTPVGRSLDLVGQAAVPLALLCAGAAIDLRLIGRRLGLMVLVATGRLLVYPLGGWMACRGLGCDPETSALLVVLLACPTAASSVAIARELGADEELMAACVVATTLLAPLTLLGWLLILSPT